MIRLFVFLSLFAVFGCRASPRRLYQPSAAQPTAAQPTTTSGHVSDNPRQALEEVDRTMRSHGYSAVGSAVRNPNMPENGLIAYSITAQPGQCYTPIAIGRPGQNLTMTVIDGQGQQVGANVNPDHHPFVQVCGATGRLVVRLQMVAGGGEYYYVAYQGPPNQQPDLAALLGGTTGPSVQRAQLDPQTEQRIAALDQRLQTQRYQRLQSEVYGETLSERQDRLFNLNLEAGQCYAFATFAGNGAGDTDVYIQDAAGNELRQDVRQERDAVVEEFCPTEAGRYTLRTLLYQGQGPVFTVGYVQSRGAAPQQANVIAAEATSGGGLEQNFRLLDADMRARGYDSFGEPSTGQLSESAERDFPIELEGGKCYAILAVGDNGVRDLDLVLLDSGGREIDRDVEQDARPVVRVCAERSGTYSMKVRMFSGTGNFVYAPYRWPRGTRGPFNLAGLIYVRLAEVTSLLEVEGYEPDVESAPGQGRLAREGQSQTHRVQLQSGQCYSILAVGGDGVSDLGISLKNGAQTLSEDQTRNAFPSVRHCAQRSGPHTVEVNAATGSGQYFYQVFRRSSS